MDIHPQQPIGIFDSGIGGLTVANAIIKHLPNEELIYFGDTAHLPYGDKSPETIQQYSLKIAEFLFEKQCKIIFIACNSASAAAFDLLRKTFKDRAFVLNVIDPVVACITDNHPEKKIGIIGTKATIGSGVYEQKLKSLLPDLKVASLATPLLVPMIEEGFCNDNISDAIIASYLSNPRLRDIEALILACTHFPLIKDDIDRYYNNSVNVIDSTDAVGTYVKKILTDNNLLNNSEKHVNHFYVSDLTESFQRTTKLFYGKNLDLQLCKL